jgi:HAE1 family hydrophobic/amphiphilic exporter-1
MLICGVLLLITIGLFYVIPKGFIPTDDTSRIVGYTEAAEGISFAEMSRHQEQIVDIIRKIRTCSASCPRSGRATSARPATPEIF